MITLKHSICSQYGAWLFIQPSDAETIEDAHMLYCDGDPEVVVVEEQGDFVGLSFHCMQQIGGNLYFNGIEVRHQYRRRPRLK